MTLQSNFIDYYRLLGVRQDASSEDIGRAFRRRAKQHHPDLNKSDAASLAFLELSEAYYVLRDADRRRKFDIVRQEVVYDRPRHERRRRSQAWATALVLVGLAGAVIFMLDTVETTDPVSDRATVARERLASAAPPVATPVVVAAEAPSSGATPAAAPTASSEPAESWEANVSPAQMPLVTAPDILDESPAADDLPAPAVGAAPPKPVTQDVPAASAPQMHDVPAHPVRRTRGQTRTYAAHASKTRASRKRHRMTRRSTKRQYASR